MTCKRRKDGGGGGGGRQEEEQEAEQRKHHQYAALCAVGNNKLTSNNGVNPSLFGLLTSAPESKHCCTRSKFLACRATPTQKRSFVAGPMQTRGAGWTTLDSAYLHSSEQDRKALVIGFVDVIQERQRAVSPKTLGHRR